MPPEEITESRIQDFLKTHMAAELATTPDQIDIHTPFAQYRLDSVVIVTLAVDLEAWLNCPLDPSVFWEFTAIADLSAWLVNDYLPGQRA